MLLIFFSGKSGAEYSVIRPLTLKFDPTKLNYAKHITQTSHFSLGAFRNEGIKTIDPRVVCDRPFAVYDHMVPKTTCWRASSTLGHITIKLRCIVLDVPDVPFAFQQRVVCAT